MSEARAVMQAAMSEAELQAAVLDLARYLGYIAFHPRPARTAHGWRTPLTGTPGFPDAVLCRGSVPARLVFVEFKARRGRVGAWQALWHAELRAAGAECYVWYPHDWHDGTIERVLA